MDQGASQNKNDSFFQKYQNWVVAGLIVAAVVVYFIVQSQNNNGTNVDDGNDNGEQTQNQGQPTPTPTATPTPTPTRTTDQNSGNQNGTGNVTARGTLRASDNAARGNLMVDSNQGKIYISTKRDFSSLIGKSVTLNAEGSLNSFKFIGFNEAVSPAQPDRGGAPAADSNVTFNGRLQNSDNMAKGNYMLVSGSTKVYLKSVRNYSAWVNSNVELKARGTINSFTNAVLVQK